MRTHEDEWRQPRHSSGGSSGGGAAGPTMSAAQLEAVAWRTVAEADYDGDAAIGRADFAKFAAARPALVRGLTERLGAQGVSFVIRPFPKY
jgi:hypothetical protein